MALHTQTRWRVAGKRFCIWLAFTGMSFTCWRPAYSSDFVDTRVTFSVSNPNVLVSPGESNPSNPGTRIGGDKNNRLFFDNYETRDSGFESLTHLVLYKSMPGYIDGLDTAAALVLRLQIMDESNTRIADDGSYVTLRYSWVAGPEMRMDRNVSLTTFPVSGDRFRLGYSYRISWGGSDIFGTNNVGKVAPGVKLQLNLPWAYVFGGLKTAQLLHQDLNEVVTNVGTLAGFGINIVEPLKLEGGFGYFQRGVNPMRDVLGEPVDALGFSTQLSWSQGIPIGSSVDFRLYENEPGYSIDYFKDEKYGPGFSFMIASEYSMLFQSLQDPEKLSTTKMQSAIAADVNARFKFSKARVFVNAETRSLGFILFNVPSFSPYVAFPEDAETSPEYFFAAGFDWYFESIKLTPGFSAGLLLPAWYRGGINSGNNPPSTLTGTRTQVVRNAGDVTILPEDADATAITALKLTSRWKLSEFLVAVGEIMFAIDNNQTRLIDDENGIAVRDFEDPYRFGFNVMLQARF